MLRDIGYAVRSLRAWRWRAAVAVATLAITIGATTSLYAFLRTALGVTRPGIEDVGAVGRIYASSRALGVERTPLSLADLQSSLAHASSFDSVAAYLSDERTAAAGAWTEAIAVGQVTEDFFKILSARAAAGRLLSPADFRTGAPVVVVSHSTWREHFEGQAVGEAVLTLEGASWTVVGVLPPEFGLPFLGIGADAWTPMTFQPDQAARPVSVIARLRSDRTWAAAAAELEALAARQGAGALWTWSAIPVEQDLARRAGNASAFLLGPAFIVLLIGCVNVSCMLLARGVDRDSELSIRCAMGATRGRILGQLIAENILLAGLGGALGCALAIGILKIIASRIAQFQPSLAPVVGGDTSVLPIAFIVSIIACVLFGGLPAVRLSRRDIATFLKGGTAPASARFAGYHARDLIVFVELGLAVVLVVVTAMWLSFFSELQRVTPLYAADQIVAVRVQTSRVRPLAETIAALPGVTSVAAASRLPGGRAGVALLQSQNGRSMRAGVVAAQSSFFHTMELPILRGRSFDPTELAAPAGVVVISEAVASALWPNEDPIGATLSLSGRPNTSRAVVVGVCRDALSLGSLGRTGLIPPDIYLPFDAGSTADTYLLARAATDAHALVRPIGVAARGSGPTMPRAVVVGDERQFVRADSEFMVSFLGAFGLVALILAASGIFGVLSQSVAQRTTEFGVRMAMGASAGQLLRMMITREGKLIAAAIASSAVCTVVVTRTVFSELVTISGGDLRVWAAIALLCGGSAAAAAILATHRIVRLDPWTVLRKM